ncbi:MAG: TolC family protein [Bacteroidales bacterium]|nr:TolC family protein [Bacteroidales bacterium]
MKLSFRFKSYLIFLIIPGLFLFKNVQSQEKIKLLSLEEAINIAKDQSPDALNAKHRFRASFWEYKTFKATFMPMLDFNATLPMLNRSINKYTREDGTETFIEQSYIENQMNLSLSKTLGLTGGQFFINSGLERLDNFSDSTTTSYMSTPVNIGYSQPIFNFNPYKWSKLIDPIKYQEAGQKYIEDIEQISITTTQHFFNLLIAQIQKKIALVNQANYDTLYKIAVGRFNLGKIAENELLQLELNFLRANATVEEANLNAENRLFRLKSFLRIKDDAQIELISPVNIQQFKVEVQKAISEAAKNRSDALAFERRIYEAERDVNRAKLENRFNADIYAVFGLTQSADNVPDVYRNPLDQQQLSLGINVPILDWGLAKGKIKMAESNQELIKTSVEQERIDFEEEVFLNVMRFNMQYDQLVIAAKADTVAAKSYEISKARYLIGKISITDLNIAQSEKDNSKSNYLNTFRTYWINYYELRKLTLYDFFNDKPILFDINNIQ